MQTRSPGRTPSRSSACASRFTRSWNSRYVKRFAPSTIASLPGYSCAGRRRKSSTRSGTSTESLHHDDLARYLALLERGERVVHVGELDALGDHVVEVQLA